ncbi:hypothetical protein TPHA_0A03690 [Tetrapisispora phaffii CBS 4417]|uniref:Exocyst complex component EXO84 n=1 Tax=Tetrapisispora phaffii (strain ATCC 24235 / CBS 4417 / NBRC 1672 / NRRL Y-8282 / UCD 70-5) TaxID=1071381 RepID=G8BNG7_TETPH|nr:hypothetical protein TPHA_0A03690 [Tetrapisispora phaffii CBS 4417]CCE61445.1 hypothetical protein TPHA_0A03690 [Tetrapisispora phaffii CBS 4417]
MVDFSLKKARTNWKNVSGSPRKGKTPPSPIKLSSKKDETSSSKKKKKTKKKKDNLDLNVSPEYSQLPTINAKERTKVASSMQRRLSVHTANYAPPKVDYSMPIPQNNILTQYNDTNQTTSASTALDFNNNNNINNINSNIELPARSAKRASAMYALPKSSDVSLAMNKHQTDRGAILQPASLRRILADPNFNAKNFVKQNLGDATALDIDKFTSNLTSLSIEVQEDVKQNVNQSYKEIMTVNNDLNITNSELKNLRKSINDLYEIMQQFMTLAEGRIKQEHQNSRESHAESTSHKNKGLLPPVRSSNSSKSRNRSSVMILEKMWDADLSVLYKNVEGSKKLLGNNSNRHILYEGNDWIELNIATLKPLQVVKLYVLNDVVLIAKRQSNSSELTASQCFNLRDLSVKPDKESGNKLYFNVSSSSKLLFQTRNNNETFQFLNTFRSAKDDLSDILKFEEEKSKKIKESFSHIASQQTPGRESMKSPVRNQRNSTSLMSPTQNGATDQYLMQTITMSMHSRPKANDMNFTAKKLKFLENMIEEFDIELARLKFDKAVGILLSLEEENNKLPNEIDRDEELLHRLLFVRIAQRRELIISTLTQKIISITDIDSLKSGCLNLIKLGLYEEGLDLLLQNRSRLILDLILKIGTYDNPTNYLTQISVIRFQIIKKTILNFEDIFKDAANKFSSILVTWCKNEVDNHFKLIDKQLLSDEMLTPDSIKSSRKQIDDLKSVGLDFVYKLDEFIKKTVLKSFSLNDLP